MPKYEEWLAVQTPDSFKARGQTKFFKEEDCQDFIDRIEEKYKDNQYWKEMLQALIVCLFRTGARISEVIYLPSKATNKALYKYGLFPQNFDLNTRDFVIIQLQTAKKKSKENVGKIRNVWLNVPDPLLDYLLRWKDKHKEGEALFPMNRITAWKRLTEIATELGYEDGKFWLHYLRASSLSLDIARGATAHEIKSKAGWGSIRFADKYIVEDFDLGKQIALKHKQWIDKEKSDNNAGT